jgi:thioesterase domain-containing protein
MAEIAARFEVELRLATLFEAPTLRALAARLDQRRNDGWQPLIAIRRTGRRPPLFFAPGAGGNPLYLATLARELGEDQPFIALQARGLDGVEPPCATVEEAAALAVDAIRAEQPSGPYLLGGHSYGGWLALAIARRLRDAQAEVGAVVIADAWPGTGLAGPETEVGADAALPLLVQAIEGTFGCRLALPSEALRAADEATQLTALQRALEQAGLLPPGSPLAPLRGQVAVFLAHHRTRFRPPRCDDLPITVLVASEPIPGAAPAEHPARMEALRAAWRRQAPQARCVDVPGHHLDMLAPAHAAQAAAAMRTALPLLRTI